MNKQKILSSWGRYPVINSEAIALNNPTWQDSQVIAYGNGRSYGDAPLSYRHIPMRRLNRFIGFNPETGLLTCESGVLLSEIIEVFLPRGWFLSITPGTKLITVGGAIAADVHGKNHHVAGCFSQCVDSFRLLLPDNRKRTCSPAQNTDWFQATCGGMGLTGIITQASFFLKQVKSQWIDQTTIKTGNLQQTFQFFEKYKNEPYSVAWIDCLSKGKKLGRSLIMIGKFGEDGDVSYLPPKTQNIPVDFPVFTLNHWSIKAFNALYYGKAPKGRSRQKLRVDAFFYPLDAIQNWNRIYGNNGFIQFQFILPKACSLEGMTRILTRISESGMGSFLAVLKLYGRQNTNWLSFPMEGYSLALDFKMQRGLVELIDELTEIVCDYEGRVYLAKDALLKKQQFDRMYPKAETFRKLRKQFDLAAHFQSLQSQRLGL